jgi:hypothetical protein
MTYLTDEELEKMYNARDKQLANGYGTLPESDSSVMLGIVLVSISAGAVGFVAGCLFMAVRS